MRISNQYGVRCIVNSRERVRAWIVLSASLGSSPRSVVQSGGPGGHYISLCFDLFFLSYLFVCLFTYGCVGSSLLCAGFL